jgi:hypothetical protein
MHGGLDKIAKLWFALWLRLDESLATGFSYSISSSKAMAKGIVYI